MIKIINNNGSTTESIKAILLVIVAILIMCIGMMIQSDLHSNVKKQEETTCSPMKIGYKVTACWKKWEIVDRFEQGKNNIIEKTKRATATFILCGNNVARVISQLKPDFKPVGGSVKVTGPVKVGDYSGLTVIQNPFMERNTYVMGYKGDSYMDAGFLLCPYIPYVKLRHYWVTNNENSVNCGEPCGIPEYMLN